MRRLSPDRRLQVLPRFLVILSLVVVAVGVVITLVGSYQIGSTWDEKTNMQSLQMFFDQGWNITQDAIINGEPNPAYIWGIYVYGPVSLLFTHMISTIAGAESWGQISFSADAYALRHIGGALIGLLGVAAAGVTVRVITRSWRWGALGAAMLAVIPSWTGHSMMNIKDGPVATGYAVATLGIVLVMRRDYFARRSVRILGLLSIFSGTFLAAGTRAASGVPIAGSVVGACLIWWLVMRREPEPARSRALRRAARRLLEAGLALVGTYLALVLLYPNVWKNPFTLFYQGVVVSAKFPFDEPILFAGTWIDQPVPWTYLPGWFAAQLPLLVLGGAVFFTPVWLWQAIRRATAGSSWMPAGVVVTTSPVLLQALMLPAIGIILQATMYNAARQFLFVVPAAAVAATLGIWLLIRWIRERSDARVWPGILWGAVAIGLVTPTAAQVALYPYTYVYVNAAAALTPVDETWPTDYWRASSNELMRLLPSTGEESCAYEQTRKGQRMPCANEPMFQPYLPERGLDAKPGTLEPGQYWVVRENQGYTQIPPGCELHDAITRPLFWQTITIGQILKCDANAQIPAHGER